MTGVTLHMGGQAAGENGLRHHRAHDVGKLIIDAVQLIIGQIDDNLLLGILIEEFLNTLIQRTAAVYALYQEYLSTSSRVPWKNSGLETALVRFHCISSRMHMVNM